MSPLNCSVIISDGHCGIEEGFYQDDLKFFTKLSVIFSTRNKRFDHLASAYLQVARQARQEVFADLQLFI